MEKTIYLKKDEFETISRLLNLTGYEIYMKFGLKRDETITYTADFGNGIEADIKVVICEDDKPYTEGVLFKNGNEVACTEPSDDILGEWWFEYNGEKYVVNVKVK